MFCDKCGAQIPEGTSTCLKCGWKYKGKSDVTLKILLSLLLIVSMLLLFFIPSDTVSGRGKVGSSLALEGLRDYYTQMKGDGTDANTILLYCIGSDLESESGCASADFQEICNADLGKNLNFVIQTGGTKTWSTEGIRGDSCQRFAIIDGQMQEIEDIGLTDMTQANTLQEFISWGVAHYPADRYDLIFWDHGGGTISGFGQDEHFPEGSLMLSNIADALEGAGVRFDFVGFDACLMGTVETAYMLSNHADYLIASEEEEGENGWYYTNWLNALGKNPSLHTLSLAKILIDDFVETGPDASWMEEAVLSVIDLREIPYVYESLNTFMRNSRKALGNHALDTFATARGKAKAFGEGEFEQIDILDYLEQVEVEGEENLRTAIQSAVKYYNTNMKRTNGLAMYYPYAALEYYADTVDSLEAYGYGGASVQYFNDFVNALAYRDGIAQQTSPAEVLTGASGVDAAPDYEQYSWYDAELGAQFAENTTQVDYREKEIIDKGTYFALHMTEEEWDDIAQIRMQVYLDDGQGYCDLGMDNTYAFDEEGDLKFDFDQKWVAINGHVVPYYAEKDVQKEDGAWYTYGFVPAVLNNAQDIEIMLQWDSAHQDGYVLGYRHVIDGIVPAPKGWIAFQSGDVVQPICSYYTDEGAYEDAYAFGQTFAMDNAANITYERIANHPVEVSFQLTDIYQNTYWTETVVMQPEA